MTKYITLCKHLMISFISLVYHIIYKHVCFSISESACSTLVASTVCLVVCPLLQDVSLTYCGVWKEGGGGLSLTLKVARVDCRVYGTTG